MQKIDLATTRIIVYRKPQRACRNSEPTIVAHVVDIVIVTIILARLELEQGVKPVRPCPGCSGAGVASYAIDLVDNYSAG